MVILSRVPAEFVLPIGLDVLTSESSLEEGYDLSWRDDDTPHYLFTAQVSVLRLARLMPAALASLPRTLNAVLEVRRTDAEMDAQPDGPEVDRYVSGPVERRDVLGVFRRYEFQLLQDGMVGFGAFDPESALEVFLDDHKLLSLWSPSLEPFEQLLGAHRVPHRRDLVTVLDFDHDHCTLPGVPERKDVPRARQLRHRLNDVAWFADAIRRRLGMRPADYGPAGPPGA